VAKKLDPAVLAHLEWLGFVQPTGLVVSPHALSQAGAILQQNDRSTQQRVVEVLDGAAHDNAPTFDAFATQVLNWSWNPKFYWGKNETGIPDELLVTLQDFQETLSPTYAVRERDPAEGGSEWQLLVKTLLPGKSFDDKEATGGHWEASYHSKFERLLREAGAPAGILFNGYTLRLVSTPTGESSGWMDFQLANIRETDGRLLAAALKLLLSEQRLLSLAKEKRLSALLVQSRRFQNTVSERLAEQVLHALYELMRGLQAAQDVSNGELLRGVLQDQHTRDEVYQSLLTVVLRLVFLLYSEERGMLPETTVFQQHYSLASLHARLRDDAALHPDTMDQRFGAWGQLLVLFRMVFDGAKGEEGRALLPQRHGGLFDPNRYPFLEGRPLGEARQNHHAIDVPRIPDGTIYRALEKLLVLDGERISYRALDVEQIGSVYETMMGFRTERSTGRSLAIRAAKKHGAPTTVSLDALLAEEPKDRVKWLKDAAARDVPKGFADGLKKAATLDELRGALDKIVDHAATPELVPADSIILQPSEARRKSGSHYTPRELTEPIVRRTLEPQFDRLREEAAGPIRPEQILDLKVCDPAMGSGAFLVEACRQLGAELERAWEAHGGAPEIPPDESQQIHAMRLVAQQCLYGVDRNPVAVELAKVSLWLATLAKDHAFTFLDHALRHGDSLVGLSNAQIAARDWSEKATENSPLESPLGKKLRARVGEVVSLRRQIREAGDHVTEDELRDLLDEAEHKASEVRTWGDLVIEAFFSADKDKVRKQALGKVVKRIAAGVDSGERARLDELRHEEPPLAPFHWELEFPEVFDRERPGMDAQLGNPPFLGGKRISTVNGDCYRDWLRSVHDASSSNADLVAHFFRRAFDHLRAGGTFGLIATNTIAQGDTRSSGLRWICENGGWIYEARRRHKWPGLAAVVVSVVHVHQGPWAGVRQLDGKEVPMITAFLFHRGGHEHPVRLKANAGQSFVGNYVLGMGFTFDDTDKKGVASSLAEMEELVSSNPRSSKVIFPYIGGSEVNDSPIHTSHRYVINFGARSEEECRREWPDLMAIVEERVKPERMLVKRKALRDRWWQFAEKQPALQRAIADLERVLVTSLVSTHLLLAFLPRRMVFSHKLGVFPTETFASLCCVQSRVHEGWARFFSSTLGDALNYSPSDCFETFPFTEDWQTHPALEAAGQAYYEFRAELMVETDLGLTKTYNRFHDPDEGDPKIARLRELHAAMDRAVLDAYGWTDIPTDCDFFPEHEGDESSKMRFRWPTKVHDEVLARLLELNAVRAEAEKMNGQQQSLAF
jgi:Eco57I restriction-modification methylase/restriction-modification enzyme MmeI-like protein